MCQWVESRPVSPLLKLQSPFLLTFSYRSTSFEFPSDGRPSKVVNPGFINCVYANVCLECQNILIFIAYFFSSAPALSFFLLVGLLQVVIVNSTGIKDLICWHCAWIVFFFFKCWAPEHRSPSVPSLTPPVRGLRVLREAKDVAQHMLMVFFLSF